MSSAFTFTLLSSPYRDINASHCVDMFNDNGFKRVNHGGGSKQYQPISSTCAYNMFGNVNDARFNCISGIGDIISFHESTPKLLSGANVRTNYLVIITFTMLFSHEL